MKQLLVLLALICLAACDPEPEEAAQSDAPSAGDGNLRLEAVSFSEIPGWDEDRLAEAVPALRRSCGRIVERDDARLVGADPRFGSVALWRPLCEDLAWIPPGDDAAARDLLEEAFRPYLVTDGGDELGTFTGYYEPEVKGAWVLSEDFPATLYRRPKDLLRADQVDVVSDLPPQARWGKIEGGRLVPYDTRAEIESGSLQGRAEPLIYLDDPVESFFLHIQGSGVVAFRDGTKRRVGFDGVNGQPFVGIARPMLERGLIGRDELSAQGVKAWLKANPEQAKALMQENPRYVFFRWIEGDGPIGGEGVPLTPGRSLAIDTRYLAYGLPLFLDTTYADGRPLQRLMVAQDTGGAIKGVVRGDLFWGHGEEALAIAGGMKQRGRYFVLLPKGAGV